MSYPATPLLRKLTAWNGWRHDLIHDAHGRLEAVVYVRVGPQWTDSVAISGEDQTIAMRHRTNDDRLILPTELPRTPGRSGSATAAAKTYSVSCSSCHDRAHRSVADGCSVRDLARPDRFVSHSTPSRDAAALAAEFCAGCPVARPCRAYARETRSQGVWGGMWFPTPGTGQPVRLLR